MATYQIMKISLKKQNLYILGYLLELYHQYLINNLEKKKIFEIFEILPMKNAFVYVKIGVLIAKYLMKYLKWFYINRQLVAFCGKVSLCNGFFHLCHYYYYYSYKRLYTGQCINIRTPINFNPQSSMSSTMIFLVANFGE